MKRKHFFLLLLTLFFATACTSRPHQPKEKLCFAFLTDVHLEYVNPNQGLEGFKHTLEQVKKTDAQFIIFGGDLCGINGAAGGDLPLAQAEELFDRFKKTVEESKIPYYACIGNHDLFFDAANGYTRGDELYEKYFGKSYYTFEKAGIRFFGINSLENRGLNTSPEQLAWLTGELKTVPDTVPVVVFQHVPIYTTVDAMPYKDEAKILAEHNFKLALQGHMHYFEDIFYQNTHFITAGAVCGAWWTGPYEGTQEGFLLVRVDENNNFTTEYVDSGWEAKK